MKPKHPLHGLVAAVHTPFNADGSLNLSVVERQAGHLLKNNIRFAFICGTTGESHSLTLEERRALANRWFEVTRATEVRVIIHVGSNCIPDARALAVEAQELGAIAISAFSPSYFKPRSLDTLIASCAEIASAAPDMPFYYYDIPSLTGVSFPMPEFLTAARDRIPNLAGIKFTNSDLLAYQLCLQMDDGAWDVPFGVDEHFLGALAMGARGAVGSGFNFAGPIYNRLLSAFSCGDIVAARKEQFRVAQLVQLLSQYGYMGAAKAVMKMLGVDVGPPRLPNVALTTEQTKELRGKLDSMGLFDWLQ